VIAPHLLQQAKGARSTGSAAYWEILEVDDKWLDAEAIRWCLFLANEVTNYVKKNGK